MKVIGQCMGTMPSRVAQILKDTRSISDHTTAISTATSELKALLPWTDFVVLAFKGEILKIVSLVQ